MAMMIVNRAQVQGGTLCTAAADRSKKDRQGEGCFHRWRPRAHGKHLYSLEVTQGRSRLRVCVFVNSSREARALLGLPSTHTSVFSSLLLCWSRII
jgi:hypothetical protein